MSTDLPIGAMCGLLCRCCGCVVVVLVLAVVGSAAVVLLLLELPTVGTHHVDRLANGRNVAGGNAVARLDLDALFIREASDLAFFDRLVFCCFLCFSHVKFQMPEWLL